MAYVTPYGQIAIAVIPVLLGVILTRWTSADRRLLDQATRDLTLAAQFGRGRTAARLRTEARRATTRALELRASNGRLRSYAGIAIIGLAGVIGIPPLASAYPDQLGGPLGTVLLVLWFVYLGLLAAGIVGLTAWNFKRRDPSSPIARQTID